MPSHVRIILYTMARLLTECNCQITDIVSISKCCSLFGTFIQVDAYFVEIPNFKRLPKYSIIPKEGNLRQCNSDKTLDLR